MALHLAKGFRQSACLALLLCFTACDGLNDPFQREGTWQPEGLNDMNLAAMVADPRQLQQGVGDDRSPGVLSAAAVHRLLTDQVKPLPIESIGPVTAAQNNSTSTPSGMDTP